MTATTSLRVTNNTPTSTGLPSSSNLVSSRALPQSTITQHVNRISERCDDLSSIFATPAQQEIAQGLRVFLAELRHLQTIEDRVVKFCHSVMSTSATTTNTTMTTMIARSSNGSSSSGGGSALSLIVLAWLLNLEPKELHTKKDASTSWRLTLTLNIVELRDVVVEANKLTIPSTASLQLALAAISRRGRNKAKGLSRSRSLPNGRLRLH